MATGWRGQYLRYKDFFLNISALYKQRADLRAFLEVVLSITTVIIFLLFALKPTALTIISLLNEIKNKEQIVLTLNQKLNDLKSAQSVFAQNAKLIPSIEQSVSNLPKPEITLQQIEGIALKDSVSILGISVGQTNLINKDETIPTNDELGPLPENAIEIPISISISGKFQNLLSFIKDLENSRTVLKIDNIGINTPSTENGQSTVLTIVSRIPYLNK